MWISGREIWGYDACKNKLGIPCQIITFCKCLWQMNSLIWMKLGITIGWCDTVFCLISRWFLRQRIPELCDAGYFHTSHGSMKWYKTFVNENQWRSQDETEIVWNPHKKHPSDLQKPGITSVFLSIKKYSFTGYRLYNRKVGVQVLEGSRIFSSPQRPDRFWGTPSLLSNGYLGLFPRGWSWPLISS
jgi:hypothetical protein